MAIPEALAIVQATAKRYMKGAQDNTIRNRFVMKELQRQGRIKYNENGTDCTWDVQYNEPTVNAYGDLGQIVFARSDVYRQLTIDWRGYIATDLASEKEMQMNKGDVAIVERYSQVIENLVKAMSNKFGAEFYNNGYAAGSENRFHGIESFCGATGTTTSADSIAAPTTSNYAGQSCVLANSGGSWTSALTTKPNAALASDWPNGSGSANYDWLAPKLVNWSGTPFSSTHLWVDACEKAIRQARIWINQTCGNDAAPRTALMSGNLFADFLNHTDSYKRIDLPAKDGMDLGFGELNFEGMTITADFDVPANTCYVMDLTHLEMASLNDQLFYSEGPNKDQRTQSYLFNVGFYGNLRWSPKHFAKLYNYA
jgi:hypothetical protein